ncbi:hypothetical protein ACFL05_01005 [Patescibacteria group bacterium]
MPKLTLEEIKRRIEESDCKLPPIDEGVKRDLKRHTKPYRDAVRKGERFVKGTHYSPFNRCPKCLDGRFSPLLMGSCNRRCEKCGHAFVGYGWSFILPQLRFSPLFWLKRVFNE